MALVAQLPAAAWNNYVFPETYSLWNILRNDAQPNEKIAWHLADLRWQPIIKKAQDELIRMASLRPNWDTYGANPPSEAARESALGLLLLLQQKAFVRQTAFVPTNVLPSSEGGVAVLFTKGDRYADIEFLNTGEVLAVKYEGKSEPDVWEITPDTLGAAIDRIEEYLTA